MKKANKIREEDLNDGIKHANDDRSTTTNNRTVAEAEAGALGCDVVSKRREKLKQKDDCSSLGCYQRRLLKRVEWNDHRTNQATNANALKWKGKATKVTELFEKNEEKRLWPLMNGLQQKKRTLR